tara:strand:- start:116 stop:352 length:237 start_codon:yes stop_codon:yes gene_type:complete
MKRFLLAPLILLVLSSCSYGSYYEARQACDKWKEAGSSVERRDCWNETYTNQVIGGIDISKSNSIYESNFKVIKRFKY